MGPMGWVQSWGPELNGSVCFKMDMTGTGYDMVCNHKKFYQACKKRDKTHIVCYRIAAIGA